MKGRKEIKNNKRKPEKTNWQLRPCCSTIDSLGNLPSFPLHLALSPCSQSCPYSFCQLIFLPKTVLWLITTGWQDKRTRWVSEPGKTRAVTTANPRYNFPMGHRVACVSKQSFLNIPSSMSGGNPPTNTLREYRSTLSPFWWVKQWGEPRPLWRGWSPRPSSRNPSSIGNNEDWPGTESRTES